MDQIKNFNIIEATIADIHGAMREGRLTARRLVQSYLDRIEAYDKSGPGINAIISINATALAEADALDKDYAASGVLKPLHGIPVIVKDQADVAGMATTMGSVLFRGHMPGRDAFAVAKLRKAGAIVIAKSTLGEMGAGDCHGSLFGSTRNVFDLERTTGGSSGGSGAAVSANFCMVAIGQEGFASIRRPAAWNGVAGIRPTAGLVSRTGVYGGWPTINGSLGPMARSVTDMAVFLDHMVGFDAADPLTAMGVGRSAASYAGALDRQSLKGARLGILRESIGASSDPASADFAKVNDVFETNVRELAAAGAIVVDPLVIPDLKALLATRARSEDEDDEAFREYISGSAAPPFKTRQEAQASPLYAETTRGVKQRWEVVHRNERHYEYLKARDILTMNMMKVMAENRLDAIVHKAVEHQPTLIEEGLKPPFRDQTGAPHLNTFLIFVPSVVVPAGFTVDNLPTGITFLGRPYDDAAMLNFAFAYEQATKHRRAPPLTP